MSRDIYREFRRDEARAGLKGDLLETLSEFFESRIRWVRDEEDETIAQIALVLEMRRVLCALSSVYPDFAEGVAQLDAGCDKLLASIRQSRQRNCRRSPKRCRR
jgi:hypothetical protein